MDKEIFISYIVPCYNIQGYLSRCLDSLSCQYIDEVNLVEYILVNDGSTDSTLSLLRSFESVDSRAIIVDQANKGVSAARNAGLKVASGKYVFFLDSDDWLTTDASQIFYRLCVNDSPDIIISNSYIVNEGKWEIRKESNHCGNVSDGIYSTYDFTRYISKLPISFKAYKRDLLLDNNIYFDEDLRVGEVYTFFLHTLIHSNSLAVSSKCVMNYLVRRNSVMRDTNIERDFSILLTIDRIGEYGQRCEFDIQDIYSYNSAFISIVSAFTLSKYVRQFNYNYKVDKLLRSLTEKQAFERSLRYMLFKHPGLNMLTAYSFGLLFCPKLIYLFLRIIIRIKKYGTERFY